MTTINTNIAAMTAANSIKTNDRSMAVAMERLSTGLRINSASDDAAGLAISTKMTSQIRGLDAAARNANDAISMIQVADGAASEITDMLQRMRELTVQSSNGVNSTTDRANLDQEFVQLAKAIDKIAETTEFNGRKILSGNAADINVSTVTFQVGANSGANEQLNVDFGDFNLAAGGAGVYESYTIASVTPLSSSGAALSFDDGQGNTISVASATHANANAQATALQGATGYDDLAYTVSSDGTGLTWTAKEFGNGADATSVGSGTLTKTDGSNVGPMGADLSGYKTTGMGTDYDATLNALDTAISGVATQRATFGATMNRLEYAVDNLASSSLATATARGRIEDANYATETTALARSQIIAQAGTAMLAQANQKSQSVLALLQ